MSISPILTMSYTKKSAPLTESFLMWVESFKAYLIEELEKRLTKVFPHGTVKPVCNNNGFLSGINDWNTGDELMLFEISRTEKLRFSLYRNDDDLKLGVDYIVTIPGKGEISSYNLQLELENYEIKYLDECVLYTQNLIRDTKTLLGRRYPKCGYINA